MTYTVLDETIAADGSGTQFRVNHRALDIEGIYAEITLPVEGERWGGQRGITVTIYPRPSTPVTIRAFTTDWPSPASTYGPLDSVPMREASYRAALDRLSDLAADWVHRYVLLLSPADR